MKRKVIKPIEIVDGRIELHFDASEESTDWLKYGRLKKRAAQGDKEAWEEIVRMRKSKMIYDEDEGS